MNDRWRKWDFNAIINVPNVEAYKRALGEHWQLPQIHRYRWKCWLSIACCLSFHDETMGQAEFRHATLHKIHYNMILTFRKDNIPDRSTFRSPRTALSVAHRSIGVKYATCVINKKKTFHKLYRHLHIWDSSIQKVYKDKTWCRDSPHMQYHRILRFKFTAGWREKCTRVYLKVIGDSPEQGVWFIFLKNTTN